MLEVVENIPSLEVVDEGAPIPVDEFVFDAQPSAPAATENDADEWYIPPANELRNVLSELDKPKAQPNKKR